MDENRTDISASFYKDGIEEPYYHLVTGINSATSYTYVRVVYDDAFKKKLWYAKLNRMLSHAH